MKESIHPKYTEAKVACACGTSFVTRSTKPSMNIDICSQCHPFFTGRQKIVDAEGRVEKFRKKYSKADAKPKAAPVKAKVKTAVKGKKKVADKK